MTIIAEIKGDLEDLKRVAKNKGAAIIFFGPKCQFEAGLDVYELSERDRRTAEKLHNMAAKDVLTLNTADGESARPAIVSFEDMPAVVSMAYFRRKNSGLLGTVGVAIDGDSPLVNAVPSGGIVLDPGVILEALGFILNPTLRIDTTKMETQGMMRFIQVFPQHSPIKAGALN